MTEGVIANALQEIQARILRAEHERAELDRAIAAAQEEEQLLLRLLGLRQGTVTAEANPGPKGDTSTRAAGESLQDKEVEKHPAVQAVISELAEVGRPLHVSDLMRRLRS